MDLDTIEGRLAYLSKRMIDGSADAIAKFKKKFEDDPYYAFEWGDAALRAAAELNVGKTIKVWLDSPKVNGEAIVKEIEAGVLRAARWPASSTSNISNEAEKYKLAAWADVLSKMKEMT